jgi:hypothetical protein
MGRSAFPPRSPILAGPGGMKWFTDRVKLCKLGCRRMVPRRACGRAAHGGLGVVNPRQGRQAAA